MQSVARPSTAGLRGAYSEGNLTDPDMYGMGVEGMRGMSGSAPWLVDNRSTRLNAAQNKYLQSNSSIFGDDSEHHAIKVQRNRQAMQDLQQQIVERKEAQLWEKAEQDRLYAAIGVPTTAEPSPGQIKDTAASVQDAGGLYGGYPGDYGGGGYDGGGGGYVPSGYGDYGAPRRLPRTNVSMTSDEVEAVRAKAAEQLRGDLQWQVEMRRQVEEERKQREALEDRLLEENAKQQQEKMQQEYQAELEQRRRKEEEQHRRREAQLRQMALVQQRVEAEKKDKMERARRLADFTENTAPPPLREDFGRDARVIKPAGGTVGGRNESIGSGKDEFGFDVLKSDSAFLAAQKPNKFFDSPSMPVKVLPTNNDARKRPKPLTPATEAPRKANNRDGWPPRTAPPAPPVALPHQPQHQQAGPHPFDWKIHVEEPSQEEKMRLQQMSQKEIDQFQEKNTDLMSQLTAMKTDLKTPRERRHGVGVGADRGEDSGYVPSHAQDPTRLVVVGVSTPPVVPSRDREDVDYTTISTVKEPAGLGTDKKETFNPDDTSRTILRKFMERKNRP